MEEDDFFRRLQALLDDYGHQKISLSDYRSARKELLDGIDFAVNGAKVKESLSLSMADDKDDVTVFDKVASLFKLKK